MTAHDFPIEGLRAVIDRPCSGIGKMPQYFPDVHRRIHRAAFQRASRVRNRHAVDRRIQNHEQIQRLFPPAIPRRHHSPRPDARIDGFDRFVRKQRIPGRSRRKFPIREPRREDPLVFAISERVRAHDPYTRKPRSKRRRNGSFDRTQAGDLGCELAKFIEL